MKALFSINKNTLKENDFGSTATADVWKQLGDDLNRRPCNIYYHWKLYIHPTLVRYESGVLDVDFKEPLINYLVDNNIVYAQEADWDEIVKNPMFYGTTSFYLHYQ